MYYLFRNAEGQYEYDEIPAEEVVVVVATEEQAKKMIEIWNKIPDAAYY